MISLRSKYLCFDRIYFTLYRAAVTSGDCLLWKGVKDAPNIFNKIQNGTQGSVNTRHSATACSLTYRRYLEGGRK